MRSTMVCLVYSTQVGVLPQENSLCGNTSHWKYWRKKASSVRTNATSITIKSIFIEKQRKIFYFLKFPKSNPMNLWDCLRFRALWHNYYMCLPCCLFGDKWHKLLTAWFLRVRISVKWSAWVWEHGRTEQFALSLPSGTEKVRMDDLQAVSWATDQFCPWQS